MIGAMLNLGENLLPQLPEPLSLKIRVEHTQEMILLFQGYAEEKPEHQEYYDSVIQHLQVVLQGYQSLYELETMPCPSRPN